MVRDQGQTAAAEGSECAAAAVESSCTRAAAAAAAKSLPSCPTLCDPIDGSPPGSPVPGQPGLSKPRGLPQGGGGKGEEFHLSFKEWGGFG